MKSLIISIVLSLMVHVGVLCQNGQRIDIKVNEYNQLYTEHHLRANQTLYGLAKYYQTPLEDLLLINKVESSEEIPVGRKIFIPIKQENIITSITSQNASWRPIYYRVKKKETLYKLSNKYFPQKLENLIGRNKIASFSLKEGQELQIGWWGVGTTESVPKSTTTTTTTRTNRSTVMTKPHNTKTSNPSEETETKSRKELLDERKRELEAIIKQMLAEEKSKEIPEDTPEVEPHEEVLEYPDDVVIEEPMILEDTLYHEQNIEDILQEENLEEERPLKYQPGIAMWDKSGDDRENLFVMHNTARVDSYIRLRYPVTGAEVTAKVVCPIPDGLYSDDIDIIITPGVALALGALDSHFQIQMDYYE